VAAVRLAVEFAPQPAARIIHADAITTTNPRIRIGDFLEILPVSIEPPPISMNNDTHEIPN
jgi:ABC-type antimicrobial peptide transport system ATPase subunit